MKYKGTGRTFLSVIFVFLLIVSVSAAQGAPLKLIIKGQYLEDGATFYTPMGRKSEGNMVALFSKSDATYGINNTGEEPLVINSIDLERAEGVQQEEFVLLTTDYKPRPLAVEGLTVQPGDQYNFMLRFYPVRSGSRKTKVTITYNGGNTHSWTVVGTGRNNAYFFSHGEVGFNKLLGTAEADEMPTAMVADKQGNMFFSAQGTMVVDRFNKDIYLGRVNSDGSLGWSWIWNSREEDRSIDPGQNGESGGSAEAMSRDSEGNIYFAGSWDKAALVLKINPETGKPLWERYWMAGWPSYSGGSHRAKDFADAYSVDVEGNNVYVTGTTQNSVMVLCLEKASGELLWQKKLDLYDGYKDRGYVVRADGKGGLYLAGIANGDAFLAKLAVSGGSPEFLWARRVKLGTGGNINSLDFDAAGNLYLSCDRRGAKTFFSLIKLTPEGKHIWGKTWSAAAISSNNSHVVRVIGDHVYFGGRIGIPSFDTQFGDGALIKLNIEDGSPAWKTFYYSGKGPGEMTEHRIKGIAKSGNSLYLYSQAYSSSLNSTRFWGYWYDGVGNLTDYKPTITPIQVKPGEYFVTLEKGAAKDVSGERSYIAGSEHFKYQDAQIKYDGENSNGELMFFRLDMKE